MGLGGISNARWGQLWRAITGWRGQNLELEIPPELRAYICLGDPESQPDWYLALNVRLFYFRLQLPAGGAGIFNHTLVLNPAGSGVITVLRDVFPCNDNGATGINTGLRSRNSVNPPAGFTQSASGSLGPLDARNVLQSGGGVFIATTQLWQLADATASYRGVTDDQLVSPAATRGRGRPVILAPGDAYVLESQVANIATAVAGWGYERDLDTGERRS